MNSRHLHTLLLILFDTVAMLVVFNLIAWLRGVAGPGHWLVTSLAGPWVFVLIATYLIDGYRSRTEMMSADYTSQHVLAHAMALIATLLLTYVAVSEASPLQGSRAVIAGAFGVLALVTLTYRRSMFRWAASDRLDRCVLFIGDHRACEEFREMCRKNEVTERVVCAVLGDSTIPPFQFESDSAVRMYEAVIDEIRSGELPVEAVVLRETSHQMPPRMAEELTELYFRGVPTYTLELFYETYWRKIPLYRINYVWLFQEGFEIARNPVFERTKRAADITLAALGLILSAPILLITTLLVKLEDGGPVFFRQSRIGRNRHPFQILKLRTMRLQPTNTGSVAPASATASPETTASSVPTEDPRYTQENDPRITAVGRFLRKSRIDEIPQLWNVLKGEMSIIGPRAEWDVLVHDYEKQIPCYHFRHLVKPGITGWAQINYPYGASVQDTLQKLEYDLYYIRHFSFVMDASIILRTVHLMLFGKGR